jgi:hypothetical protein
MGMDGIDRSVAMRGETWNALVREKCESDERVNKVRITDEKGWKRMWKDGTGYRLIPDLHKQTHGIFI